MAFKRVLLLSLVAVTASRVSGQDLQESQYPAIQIIPGAGSQATAPVAETQAVVETQAAETGVIILPISASSQDQLFGRDAVSQDPVIAEPMINQSVPNVPSGGNQPSVNPTDYARVYQTIPFNRTEYNANPSYRHDSTMEILTGNARHQTIVRHSTAAPRPVQRTAPTAIPYRYNNRAWGLNYYFYFPYWNYRGLY